MRFKELLLDWWALEDEELSVQEAQTRLYSGDKATSRDTLGTELGLARAALAKQLAAVRSALREAGVAETTNAELATPYMGFGRVSILTSVFRHKTSYLPISRQVVIDTLDTGIGAYENMERSLRWQLVNPGHWLVVFFGWIAAFPLKVLVAAGLDKREIEKWAFIKWMQVIWVAAILGIALLLGLSLREVVELLIGRLMPVSP